MNIKNRMDDIDTLRCCVCQDFLKLILVPDWKQRLYKKAKNAVEVNCHKDNYIEAYNKMRDNGIEAYSVDCMDVSFIAVIVFFCSEIAPTQKRTRDFLRKLIEDRNTISHSSKNETEEDLYRRGFLAIENIICFIREIDTIEVKIVEEDRLYFRKKWIKKATELEQILADERIEYIQVHKDFNQSIKEIKESKDMLAEWVRVCEKYKKYYGMTAESRFYQFAVVASDEGITFAHNYAALYFAYVEHNYDEALKRLSLLCYCDVDFVKKGDVQVMLDSLNYCVKNIEKRKVPKIEIIIKYLSSAGFDIYKNENGDYKLRKK